jgi:Fe2+ transport system protein FeoA
VGKGHSSLPRLVGCPMCGHFFDPVENEACGSCPAHGGCSLICCPVCGYSSVDPARSRLVGLGSRLRTRCRARFRGHRGKGAMTLADAPRGTRVRINELAGLSSERRHQLQAYGLTPGGIVEIVQQSPVTVVKVDHLDLAFESVIARGIRVEPVARESGDGRMKNGKEIFDPSRVRQRHRGRRAWHR